MENFSVVQIRLLHVLFLHFHLQFYWGVIDIQFLKVQLKIFLHTHEQMAP